MYTDPGILALIISSIVAMGLSIFFLPKVFIQKVKDWFKRGKNDTDRK